MPSFYAYNVMLFYGFTFPLSCFLLSFIFHNPKPPIIVPLSFQLPRVIDIRHLRQTKLIYRMHTAGYRVQHLISKQCKHTARLNKNIIYLLCRYCIASSSVFPCIFQPFGCGQCFLRDTCQGDICVQSAGKAMSVKQPNLFLRVSFGNR